MATAPTSNHSETSLAGSATALFVGLLWGAIMLILMGFWMRWKYEAAGRAYTIIFVIAGLASLALAVWQAFTLWIKKESAEQKTATLGQQRRILGTVLLFAGFGLIACSFVLGIGKKPEGSYGFLLDNLAESVGVLLFGMIALGTGYFLTRPTSDDDTPIRFLTQQTPILKLIQIVLAVLAIGALVAIVWTNRINSQYLAWLPELIALLFLSILCLACFLWLNAGSFDEFGTRLFVLIFGGALGFILFTYAFGRAILWRQDIFLGGIPAWQGEFAWRFWALVYLQFIALVVMFVSFGLAKADIRTNVYLRRVMYGYDALLQVLLVVEVLVVFNVVVYALLPFTFDWTKTRGAYALSDSSKHLITNLKQETEIFVLLPQNDLIYKDIRNLMDNCQALSNKLKVQYVSPDSDPNQYENLAKLFPKILPDSPMSSGGRGILLVYGPMPLDEKHTTPNSFVRESKLFERTGGMRPGDKATFVFKGEAEILKELKFLAAPKENRKIYFLQGDDEPSINTDEGQIRRETRQDFGNVGIGILVEKMKQDQYDVWGLSFGSEPPGEPDKNAKIVYLKEDGNKRCAIPDDCKTLIVAGVGKPLQSIALDAIDHYMENGGKMLVFLDVIANSDYSKLRDSGLEPLLKRYGVEVTNEFALQLPVNQRDDPSLLLVTAPTKSENPLAKQFASGRSIQMGRSARVFKDAETPGRFKAEPVLHLDRRRGTVLEKDVRVLRQNLFLYFKMLDDKMLLRTMLSPKDVPVAMAVTDTNGEKARMVVFGDTDFITNVDMARSPTRAVNYDFVTSSLEWLAEREGIGASPKVSPTYSIDPDVDLWRMVLLPGWLMLLIVVCIGVGIWIVRRR